MKIPSISTVKVFDRVMNKKFVKYGFGAALAFSAIQLSGCTKERDFDDLIVQPKPPKNDPIKIVINDSLKTYEYDVTL